MAQRLVRAKGKIREAGFPIECRRRKSCATAWTVLLLVVYLIFNEGYLASSGDAFDPAGALRGSDSLGRVMCSLLPAQAEAQALLGLLLLQDSRRDARVSAQGELVLLEEQDRGLWHGEQIQEGRSFVKSALRRGVAGAYAPASFDRGAACQCEDRQGHGLAADCGIV